MSEKQNIAINIVEYIIPVVYVLVYWYLIYYYE